MIGENDGGRKITVCDLPKSADDLAGFYAMMTGVLVLLITGIVRSLRGRRVTPSVILGVALLALWAYEFFGQTLGCPRGAV